MPSPLQSLWSVSEWNTDSQALVADRKREGDLSPAVDEGTVEGVAERSRVGHVEEDEEEAGGLGEEAEQDDRIAAVLVGARAEDAEEGAARDLADADEDARQAHQRLAVGQAQRRSHLMSRCQDAVCKL